MTMLRNTATWDKSGQCVETECPYCGSYIVYAPSVNVRLCATNTMATRDVQIGCRWCGNNFLVYFDTEEEFWNKAKGGDADAVKRENQD